MIFLWLQPHILKAKNENFMSYGVKLVNSWIFLPTIFENGCDVAFKWLMGVLSPGPEAVGVCKLWGIYRLLTSPARTDAESPTNPYSKAERKFDS